MEKIVRLIKLPPTIRGMTVTDQDGNYNIYLNRNLAFEMQKETFQHEKIHIENNDFQRDEPVSILEEEIEYEKNGNYGF